MVGVFKEEKIKFIDCKGEEVILKIKDIKSREEELRLFYSD
ncbi:hypothetical protein bcgnr5406_13920 [Bacillus cereus]|uniref:Uncharacterized protein n=1 Tax=Bacillus cereus TaxID=1396 RepID=A0A162NT33_BACCE|nr:hypothetical protein B4088_6046 [Bacillus cereus]